MRKKRWNVLSVMLVWLFSLQASVVYGCPKVPLDSTGCIFKVLGNDCACKFTDTTDLAHVLNATDDNCILQMVDTLIENGNNINCRKSLDRIIGISDGYLSEYLSSVLASALLRDPINFFSRLYDPKLDRESNKHFLLVDGLSILYLSDHDIFKYLDNFGLKCKVRRALNSIRKDTFRFIKLNPDL